MNLVNKCKIAWLRWRHPNLEELTEDAKECYALANAAAVDAGTECIGSCHLLTALLNTPSLAQLDPDRKIRDAASHAHYDDFPQGNEPLKAALEQAIEIAREKKLRTIDPKLLLLGMMKLQKLRATQILEEHGLSIGHIEKTT